MSSSEKSTPDRVKPTGIERLVNHLSGGDPLPQLSKRERRHVHLLARAAKAGLLQVTAKPQSNGGLTLSPELRYQHTPE
jgi:hypothetical protein